MDFGSRTHKTSHLHSLFLVLPVVVNLNGHFFCLFVGFSSLLFFRLSMLACAACFFLPFVLDGGNLNAILWSVLYLYFSYFTVKNAYYKKRLSIYV